MSYREVPVLCVTTGEVFNSMKEAAEKCGICKASISLCCGGRQEHAGGLQWRYAWTDQSAGRSTTLCWGCHLSDHWEDEPTPCPWATRFEPVEGWMAVPTDPFRGDRKLGSFKVIQCPLFKPNERRRKHDKRKAKSL